MKNWLPKLTLNAADSQNQSMMTIGLLEEVFTSKMMISLVNMVQAFIGDRNGSCIRIVITNNPQRRTCIVIKKASLGHCSEEKVWWCVEYPNQIFTSCVKKHTEKFRKEKPEWNFSTKTIIMHTEHNTYLHSAKSKTFDKVDKCVDDIMNNLKTIHHSMSDLAGTAQKYDYYSRESTDFKQMKKEKTCLKPIYIVIKYKQEVLLTDSSIGLDKPVLQKPEPQRRDYPESFRAHDFNNTISPESLTSERGALNSLNDCFNPEDSKRQENTDDASILYHWREKMEPFCSQCRSILKYRLGSGSFNINFLLTMAKENCSFSKKLISKRQGTCTCFYDMTMTMKHFYLHDDGKGIGTFKTPDDPDPNRLFRVDIAFLPCLRILHKDNAGGSKTQVSLLCESLLKTIEFFYVLPSHLYPNKLLLYVAQGYLVIEYQGIWKCFHLYAPPEIKLPFLKEYQGNSLLDRVTSTVSVIGDGQSYPRLSWPGELPSRKESRMKQDETMSGEAEARRNMNAEAVDSLLDMPPYFCSNGPVGKDESAAVSGYTCYDVPAGKDESPAAPGYTCFNGPDVRDESLAVPGYTCFYGPVGDDESLAVPGYTCYNCSVGKFKSSLYNVCQLYDDSAVSKALPVDRSPPETENNLFSCLESILVHHCRVTHLMRRIRLQKQPNHIILHKAMDVEVADLIIKSVSSAERDSFVMAVDRKGRTVLHKCMDGDLAELIIQSVSEGKRQEFISMRDIYGCTVFHTCQSHDVLIKILQFMDENKKEEFIFSSRNIFGSTCLHMCTDSQIAISLLDSVSLFRRQAFVTSRDNDGNTVLHTTSNSDVVKAVTDSLDKYSKQSFLMAVNRKKQTVLHVSSSSAVVESMLDSLSDMDKKVLIQFKDDKGRTPLHMQMKSLVSFDRFLSSYKLKNCSVYNSQSVSIMKVLLKSLDLDSKDGLILCQDYKRRTVLHYCKSKSMAQLMVNAVSTKKREELLLMEDIFGLNALHYCTDYELAKYLASIISQPSLRNMLKAPHKFIAACTEILLFNALQTESPVSKEQHLLGISRSFPDEGHRMYIDLQGHFDIKYDDLAREDDNGSTLFTNLVINQNRKLLYKLLQPLTLQERRFLLTSKNKNGFSTLELAYKSPAELFTNSLQFLGYRLAENDYRPLSLARNTEILKTLHYLCNEYVNDGISVFNIEQNLSIKEVLSSKRHELESAFTEDFRCLVLLIDFATLDPSAAYLQSCIDQLNQMNFNGRPKVLYFQRRTEPESMNSRIREDFDQLLGSIVLPPDCAVLSALTFDDLRVDLVKEWENLHSDNIQQQLCKLKLWLQTHPNTRSQISSSLGRRLYFKRSMKITTGDLGETAKEADLKVTTEEADVKVTTEEADVKVTTEEADVKVTTEKVDVKVTTEEADVKVTTEKADVKIATMEADVKAPLNLLHEENNCRHEDITCYYNEYDRGIMKSAESSLDALCLKIPRQEVYSILAEDDTKISETSTTVMDENLDFLAQLWQGKPEAPRNLVPDCSKTDSWKCNEGKENSNEECSQIYEYQPKRGACLILCFTKGRSTWSEEKDDVESILGDLNIQAERKTDLTADQIEESVKSFSMENEDREFLMIIVMSHGNCRDDILLDDSGNYIKIQLILDALNINKSQPKVVIFQHCRGKFRGTKLPDNDERNFLKSSLVTSGYAGSNILWSEKNTDLSGLSSYSVPENFYVVFSTLKDCNSRRGLLFKEMAEHIKELKHPCYPPRYSNTVSQDVLISAERRSSEYPWGYFKHNEYKRACIPIPNEIAIDIVDFMTDVAGRVRNASLLVQHVTTENNLTKPVYLRLSQYPIKSFNLSEKNSVCVKLE